MKIGVVSRIGEFPETFWEEEFKTFSGKVSHFELMVNYPHLGPLDCTSEKLEMIREFSEKYGIELIFHLLPNQYGVSKEKGLSFSSKKEIDEFLKHEEELKNKFFNPASLDEKVRNFSKEEILRTLEMAKRVGAKLITIHGGSFTSEEVYQEALLASRKTLEELNSKFREVKLCVENLPTKGYLGENPKQLSLTPKDILYLVNGLNNIGITFDTGHANVPIGTLNFYEGIKEKGKIWDMHVHDNNGDKDNHLPLGSGSIPFWKFLRALKEDDYRSYFSVELDTWCRYPEKGMEKHERLSALEYIKK